MMNRVISTFLLASSALGDSADPHLVTVSKHSNDDATANAGEAKVQVSHEPASDTKSGEKVASGAPTIGTDIAPAKSSEEQHPATVSFLENSAEISEAQAKWQSQRRQTDALLSQVHKQIAELNENLKRTSEKQQKDLALLEEDRKRQDKEIEQEAEEIRKFSRQPLPTPKASFLEGSNSIEAIVAPIKKAAEDARKFAEEIKSRQKSFQEQLGLSADPASFLESSAGSAEMSMNAADASTDAADKSLRLAQQNLNKLAAEIDLQKKQLEADKKRLDMERRSLDKNGATSMFAADLPAFDFGTQGASFLQVNSEENALDDPLSPQSLQRWKAKFEATLDKARNAAKMWKTNKENGSPVLSFMQTENKAQEKLESASQSSLASEFAVPQSFYEAQNERIKEKEHEVEVYESQYKSAMQRLKEDNEKLLSEAKEQMAKSKEIRDSVERRRMKGSLLEIAQPFDAEKAAADIKNLQQKWKQEAADISNLPIAHTSEELNAQIEATKQKRQENELKMEQYRKNLNVDIEKLHKDVSLLHGSQPNDGISFLQTEAAPRQPTAAELALDKAEKNLNELMKSIQRGPSTFLRKNKHILGNSPNHKVEGSS